MRLSYFTPTSVHPQHQRCMLSQSGITSSLIRLLIYTFNCHTSLWQFYNYWISVALLGNSNYYEHIHDLTRIYLQKLIFIILEESSLQYLVPRYYIYNCTSCVLSIISCDCFFSGIYAMFVLLSTVRSSPFVPVFCLSVIFGALNPGSPLPVSFVS